MNKDNYLLPFTLWMWNVEIATQKFHYPLTVKSSLCTNLSFFEECHAMFTTIFYWVWLYDQQKIQILSKKCFFGRHLTSLITGIITISNFVVKWLNSATIHLTLRATHLLQWSFHFSLGLIKELGMLGLHSSLSEYP